MQNTVVGLERLASLYKALSAVYGERPMYYEAQVVDNLRPFLEPLPPDRSGCFEEGREFLRRALTRIDGIAYPELIIEVWQQDYRRLFASVPLPHIVPRESAYRGGGERLCDEPTIATRQAYVEAEFIPNSRAVLPDDHIATELAFIAYLYQQAADAMHRDYKDTERWLMRKQLFVQRHLRQWTPTFCDEIVARAQTNFWKGIALLTKGLVEFEDPCQ